MFSVLSLSQVFDQFSLATFFVPHTLQTHLLKIYLAQAACLCIKAMASEGRTDSFPEASCKCHREETHLDGKVVAEPQEQETFQMLYQPSCVSCNWSLAAQRTKHL